MQDGPNQERCRGRAWGRGVFALGVFVALLLGGRWLLGSLSDPAPTEVARSGGEGPQRGTESADDALAEGEGNPGRVVLPEAEVVTPDSGDATALTENAGTGTLEILVLDEVTGDPLPDHEFRLFKERDGYQLLAKGRTDAKGRALYPRLAENLYAIETLRAPPFAPAVGAAWLEEGGSTELELRVGAGGTFTGRVVDDLGEPLGGANLGLSSWGHGLRRGVARDEIEKQSIATTDEDGRFRIEHVASAPSGLWRVEDELRVERWEAIRVYAYYGDGKDWSEHHVRAGETVAVPDLVVPRVGTWHGRVVDESGAAIPGALVSPRNGRWVAMDPLYAMLGDEWDRWRGFPGDEGFALQGPEEVLTDGEGRFEFTTRRADHRCLTVLTPDRRVRRFDRGEFFPRVAPGERSEELILRIDTELRWTLHFHDERGGPLDVRSSFGRQGQTWPMGNWPANWQASRAFLLLEDQRTEEVNLEVNAETGVEAVLPLRMDPRRVRGVRVQVVGYSLANVMFTGTPMAEESIDVTLEPWGRVKVRFEDAEDVLEEDQRVYLHTALTRVRPTEEQPYASAGLGSHGSANLGPDGVETDFVAQAPGDYWVVLQTHFGLGIQRVYGPLQPGLDRTPIPVDREFLEALLPKPPEETETVAQDPPPPPPESVAPEARQVGQLRVRVVDASTGEPLSYFSVGFGRDPESGERGASWWTVNTGSLAAETEVGTIWFRVHATNYRPSALLKANLVEGEVADMGAVALEPLPRYAGRLVDPDGRPVGAGQLWVSDAEGEFTATPSLDAGGKFAILGEIGRDVILQAEVEEPLEDFPGPGFQQLEVRRWPTHVEEILELEGWRPLEIVVQGLDPNLSGASLSVQAEWVDAMPRPQSGGFGGLGRLGYIEGVEEPEPVQDPPPSTRATEFAWSPDADRHFGVVAGPGRVRIRVMSPLHEFEPIEIQVTAGAEVQRVEIAPR